MVGDQEFERKAVELGISDGILVQIKNGITTTDNIKVWNTISEKPEDKEE